MSMKVVWAKKSESDIYRIRDIVFRVHNKLAIDSSDTLSSLSELSGRQLDGENPPDRDEWARATSVLAVMAKTTAIASIFSSGELGIFRRMNPSGHFEHPEDALEILTGYGVNDLIGLVLNSIVNKIVDVGLDDLRTPLKVILYLDRDALKKNVILPVVKIEMDGDIGNIRDLLKDTLEIYFGIEFKVDIVSDIRFELGLDVGQGMNDDGWSKIEPLSA